MPGRRLGLVAFTALAVGGAVALNVAMSRRPAAAVEAQGLREQASLRSGDGAAPASARARGERRAVLAHGATSEDVAPELARPSESDTVADELARDVLTGSDLAARLAALHELARLEGDAVSRSLAAIAYDDSLPLRVRREAMLLLANHPGDVAFETFREMLRSEEIDLKLAAAQGLGILGDARALSALTDAFFAESSATVARAIVQSMSRLGTPAAVEALMQCSWSGALPPGMSVDEVLGALAGVDNPQALDALTHGLESASDTASRRALVSALAKIADPASMELLVSIAGGDPDLETRCEAMQGLGWIGSELALPTLRERALSGSDKERSYAETAIERIEAGL